MPIYKGSAEVASGNLYKGSTEIENGYKATDIFYVNEIAISFATPTGQSLTYTTPSPQSSNGAPGSSFTTTTFTVTSPSNILSGTASVSGLPSTLSITGQSYNGSSVGNILTITIGGTFPTNNALNIALVVSGLTSSNPVLNNVTLTWNNGSSTPTHDTASMGSAGQFNIGIQGGWPNVDLNNGESFPVSFYIRFTTGSTAAGRFTYSSVYYTNQRSSTGGGGAGGCSTNSWMQSRTPLTGSLTGKENQDLLLGTMPSGCSSANAEFNSLASVSYTYDGTNNTPFSGNIKIIAKASGYQDKEFTTQTFQVG